ncbi:unnamed protein product [Victoria cruziana]
MDKENICNGSLKLTARITRARAAAFRASSIPLGTCSMNQEKKAIPRRYPKRVALDDNQPALGISNFQSKRQAVLRDVSNIVCESSYANCIKAAKMKTKICKNVKLKTCVRGSTFGSSVDGSAAINQENLEAMAQKSIPADALIDIEHAGANRVSELSTENTVLTDKDDADMQKGEKTTATHIIDIDVDHKDPQMCSLYAPEIYAYLREAELKRKPSHSYMSMVQQDISPAMRAILIDWLVEVCEEYRLVPDTLYLAVYYIDRFLSSNPVERKMLQLVGITCMFIASKYEEICAPRVDDFCLITDNTYNRQQVLKMEIAVLNHLRFELTAPTTKTFLRRFLRAAQASNEMVRDFSLEFLANYLAELTLLDYRFLKFVPSRIAASAVFLAKWTLDQLSHPWNPTLEHYTNYKALELKTVVFEIHRMQMDTKEDHPTNLSLKAIREKYSQQKFKSVAALSFPRPLDTLFQ